MFENVFWLASSVKLSFPGQNVSILVCVSLIYYRKLTKLLTLLTFVGIMLWLLKVGE